jgi:hypothetical protein
MPRSKSPEDSRLPVLPSIDRDRSKPTIFDKNCMVGSILTKLMRPVGFALNTFPPSQIIS